MNLGYFLVCTRCGSRSEPQNGTTPGPYTTRVCEVCLTSQRCEVVRVTSNDNNGKGKA